MSADLPSSEERRLSFLDRVRLLDTEPEESFDQLTKLAARHFQVPMAVVTLVDRRRQWFKSCLGLNVRETDRDIAFCAHAIQSDDVFVVNDAALDPAFTSNPLVTADPFIRFYAGAPLIVAEGVRLGTFAILDRKPRTLSDQDVEALNGFARLAVNFINQRLATLKLTEAERALLQTESSIGELLVDNRKTEERYRLLFDSNPLASLVYSTEGDYKILAANEAAVNTYGYTHEEFLGLTMYDLVASDLREALRRRMERIIANHPTTVSRSTAFPHRTKTGQKIEAEITSHPLEFDNRPARLVIVNDVTEVVEAQEKMREALELAETAAEARADFLATMSHEIRTPINGVVGMTNLLLDTELSPEQREYTETIRRSGETLITLVNDILDFSKIDSGRLEIETVPFDLWTMAEESLEMVAETAHRKDLELISDIDPQVPSAVTGDPLRVRQILLNLLSNAIKFTSKGEVRLHLTVVRRGPEHDQAVIRFAVIDTGIGITQAAKERLFRSFSQGEASTSRLFGGTGLGLAISKRLTQIMSGVIGFESEAGLGAQFWVELPLTLAAPLPEPADTGLRGRRVMIVDDHSNTLQVLRRQLERMGAEVTTASSSLTALALLSQATAKMDACLIDSNLGGMSGIETARQLRGLKGMAALPVALMTRVTERHLMAEPATRKWVDVACAKPLKRAQLISTLTRLIDQPDDRSAPAPPDASQQPPASQDGIRFLLVEDNLINQKLAVHLVKKLGHRVDVASNGREAVEMFRQTPYSIVLMDAQMPEMDGYEATAAIRELESSGQRAVIIGLTANVMPGDRDRCLAAGMDDYIPKPIQAASFHQILLGWMERIREQSVF